MSPVHAVHPSAHRNTAPDAATPPDGAAAAPATPPATGASAVVREHLARLLHPGAPAEPAAGYRVRRAWPADLGDLDAGVVLELDAAASTPERAPGPHRVGATLTARGLHVLHGDPRLPTLAAHLAAGADVVSLRPGKRAVLRAADGRFIKLARRSATRRALDAQANVDALLAGVPGAPARPEFVGGNASTGTLELAPAPGIPLSEALARAETPADVLPHALACAAALSALASVVPAAGEDGVGTHTLADEATVLARWAVAALELAPLTDVERVWLTGEAARVAHELRDAAGAGIAGDADPVLAHRDLHDGQILCARPDAPGGPVALTFLDWDTAAWAHPAADLANLVAHVDRLAHLGRVRPPVAQGFHDHLLDALDAAGHPAVANPSVMRVLNLLIDATALRLVAVHAFRPR